MIWKDFKKRLESFGIEENTSIHNFCVGSEAPGFDIGPSSEIRVEFSVNIKDPPYRKIDWVGGFRKEELYEA